MFHADDCMLGDTTPRMSSPPLVSIVIATYNRSRVLAHAIDSVRRSTLTDWEAIVVGDHCTDDTADVVSSFEDARISFVNLARNVGEQSGPNNEGIARARGRYLAFLNHDDLYLPDHLERAVAQCACTQADLVWSPLIVALPTTETERAAGASRFRLSGVTPTDDYDPRVFVFASAWLMTRAFADRVGPWRPARATFVTSSQDWLFRAWRTGARMTMLPHPTVLAVPASARDGSYVAGSPEHERFGAAMRDNPAFRDDALRAAAVAGERETNRFRFGLSWGESVRALAFRPISAAAMACGVHPHAPFVALRHGRRGNLVSAIRRRSGLRGLDPGN